MFIRGSNPIWFFNNLSGSPVDTTYYAFFLTNTLPYLPQNVYQDPNGINAWSDPIEFQVTGGLPDNIYFDPSLVYRIEIRQGPTQNDPLIYLVQNYSLSSESEGNATTALTTAPNLITNSQFSDVFFPGTTLTVTTAGSVFIAPGWQLVTTGVGSTTITQATNAGSTDTQGNPPYYLTFNNSGWTTVQLRQTFNNNGAIFSGGAVSAAITGFASSTSQPISIVYAPNSGNPTTILSQTLQVGGLVAYGNAVNIPLSTNATVGFNANVSINIVLPSNGIVSITNVQITGQSLPLPAGFTPALTPLFQEITYERNVDQEFHVYINSLINENKNNLLVGWNFALNPWQFATKTITNVPNTQFYTADQTILIQQNVVASNTGNNVAVGQGTVGNNLPYTVQAVSANNQFAILQYIDPATIAPYWGQKVSVMVRASINTSHSSNVNLKMRLIYISTIPTSTNQTYPIASWTAGSDPVMAGGFTAIAALNDPIFLMPANPQFLPFNQFQLPAATTSTMTLGVLIYTVSNMNQNATADQIYFNRVSLVNNDFAIDLSYETYDESFAKCQYYFEQSYNKFSDVGTNTFLGAQRYSCPLATVSGTNSFYLTPFDVEYKRIKRAVPNITFYSPTTGASGQVRMTVQNQAGAVVSTGDTDYAITNWQTLASSQTNYTAIGNTSTPAATSFTATASSQGSMYFHYVADARIGI